MPATAERIEDFASTANLPKIAVDEGRHAHSVWLHSTDSGPKIRTNRFEQADTDWMGVTLEARFKRRFEEEQGCARRVVVDGLDCIPDATRHLAGSRCRV